MLALVFLPIIQKEELMASERSCKNQNSNYQGEFQWIFGQEKLNLVSVSREFQLSEFK